MTASTPRTRKAKTAAAPPVEQPDTGVEAAAEVEAPTPVSVVEAPAPAASALEPPVAKPVEEPKGPQPRSIAEVGVAVALNNTQQAYLYDAATGQPPADLDGMFVQEQPHHTFVTCTVRLMERTQHGPRGTLFDRLVLPRGAQISTGHAGKLIDLLREQAAREL